MEKNSSRKYQLQLSILRCFLFISSKNSNESEYTCGEILKAKKARKLIIPFLIDESDYNEKFEILLLPLNHIDYVNQPNTALPELLRTVNKEKDRIRLPEFGISRLKEHKLFSILNIVSLQSLRFVVKEAICSQCCDHIHDEVVDRPVP